jgi:hypothetical protein
LATTQLLQISEEFHFQTCSSEITVQQPIE